MAKVTLQAHEYNFMASQWQALDRLAELLLDERGVDVLTIGNVHIYRALDHGVGAVFVDENGAWLTPLNHAFADYGIGELTPMNLEDD